jgi:Ran GTPase-activating protein (RanGAP) involved in mRNA processing and transport
MRALQASITDQAVHVEDHCTDAKWLVAMSGALGRGRVIELTVTGARLFPLQQEFAFSHLFTELTRAPTSQTLTHINLSKNHFDAAKVDSNKWFLSALAKCQALVALDLSHNTLGARGIDAFVQAFRGHPSLRTLHLQNTGLATVECFASVADMLKTSMVLTLNLSANACGPSGVDKLATTLLANHTLERLDLSSTRLGEVGATHLAGALKVNRTLQSLLLRDNQLQNGGAQSMAGGLHENASLIQLDLSHNSIGSAGAANVAAALHGRGRSVLSVLNLSNNQIGCAGATAFAEVLKTNSHLSSLDVSLNGIASQGLSAMAKVLRLTQTLRHLALDEPVLRTAPLSVVNNAAVLQFQAALGLNPVPTVRGLATSLSLSDREKGRATAMQSAAFRLEVSHMQKHQRTLGCGRSTYRFLCTAVLFGIRRTY